MNKILNIALNIETLSRKTNAAIIAITAVPFERRLEADTVNGQEMMDLGPLMDQSEMFHRVINGTSCVMEGLDVEPDTVQWWKNHTELDKSEILEKAVSLQSALQDFAVWINSLRNEKDRYKAETMEVWILGPTFDWPILMNAYRATGITFMYPHQCHVRDIRTYCENAVMITKGVKKAYADHWRANLDGYSEDVKAVDFPKIMKLVEMVRAADRMMAKAALVSRKTDGNIIDTIIPPEYHRGGLIPTPAPSPKLGPGYNPDPIEPVILGPHPFESEPANIWDSLSATVPCSMTYEGIKPGMIIVVSDNIHNRPVIATVADNCDAIGGCLMVKMPVYICNEGWVNDNECGRQYLTEDVFSSTFVYVNGKKDELLFNREATKLLDIIEIACGKSLKEISEDDKYKDRGPVKFLKLREIGFGWHSIIRYYQEGDDDPRTYYTLMIDNFKKNGVVQYHAVMRHNPDGTITPINTKDPVTLNLTVRDCRDAEVFPVPFPEAQWMLKLFKENWKDIDISYAGIGAMKC